MIVVENVAKYYGSLCAVRDLNFTIREGECIGFLGLNGAGKTTTLRLLSSLLLPTAGRIRIRDLDVIEQPHAIRHLIGYLPESPPLYQEMTVREYLDFAGRLRGMDRRDLAKRVPEVMEVCNLQDVQGRTIGTLSHGFRQRVGIAQAVIHRPALLILDEPIQGLDPVQIVDMRNMIGALRGEHTILLSTHILTEIEQTCDRILMMNAGRIAAEGTEEELARRYGTAHSLELQVTGTASDVKTALSAVAGVTDLEVLSERDGQVEVRLRVPAEQRAEVSRAVVQGGLGLLSMHEAATGLEGIFVRLSRGDESDGSQASPEGSAA